MKFFKYLDSLTDWLEMLIISSMVLAIFIQVVWRYVLNNALPWPEEVARYLFCWSTYVAVAISMRSGENLRITILLDMLKPKTKAALNLFVNFINVVFFALLTYLSWDITIQVMELEELMASIAVPVWIVWAGLPVCFALITLQAVRNLYLTSTDLCGRLNNKT